MRSNSRRTPSQYGSHERIHRQPGQVAVADRRHRVQRVHRRHTFGVRRIGEDVHERPARVPVGPAALPGQADHVRVVQIQGDAQRVGAVHGVIVGEIVAHADEEMRRASQLARDVGRRAAAGAAAAAAAAAAPPPLPPPPPPRAPAAAAGEDAGERDHAARSPGHPTGHSAAHRQSLGARRGGSGNMPVMSRLMVGVATVATLIGVAGSAHAQVTPGPRRAPPPAAPTRAVRTFGRRGQAPVPRPRARARRCADVLRLLRRAPARCCSTRRCARRTTSRPHWSGGLTLRQWWLPGSNHATMYGLTARYEPIVSSYGRVFGDVAIGMTSTSTAWSFGFDVGAGIEWDLPDVAGLSMGPYLRYGQVLNPDSHDERRRPRLVGGRIVHVSLRPRGGEREARRGRAAQRRQLLPPLGPRLRSRRRRRRPGRVPQRRAGQTSRSVQAGLPGERRGRRRRSRRRRRLPGVAAGRRTPIRSGPAARWSTPTRTASPIPTTSVR